MVEISKHASSSSVAESREGLMVWFCSNIRVTTRLPASCRRFHLLVLLLLLFQQLVDLPLGHGGVLCDDAVLVHTRQKQQEADCGDREGLPSGTIGSAAELRPHPPMQQLRCSDLLFLVAPQTLSYDGP